MNNWILTLFIVSTGLSFGQKNDKELAFDLLKQTLPQVLDQNPNSIACNLKGGAMYELMLKAIHPPEGIESPFNEAQVLKELDSVAESVSKLLETHKITVVLSDTLFAYTYKPRYSEDNNGWVDTTDLRNPETWQYEREELIDVFQTNYAFRGMSRAVDLAFIDLVKAQIHFKGIHYPINLSELNSSHYEFTNSRPFDSDTLRKQGLLINAVRVYQPVFNESNTKACYLFSAQAKYGPWREFVFAEKKKGIWYFVESWGSYHVDGNDNWLGE